MRTILTLVMFLIFTGCFAHPGIGIVRDRNGNIFYTDLKQVWKIDPVSGKRSIAVPGVHTHELSLDKNDNLYGEHLWYNGEVLDTWGHYVWCLRSDGKLDTIIKPSAGFLENYSFVRDSSDNMYSVQRFKAVSRIQKNSSGGNVTILAEGKFKNVRWMHVTPAGTVYFVDLTDLYKVDSSGLHLLAANLQERTSLTGYTDLQHNIYGLWLDAAENIYAAILGGQVVKKISPDGKIKDIVYSTGTWRPCSGVFDNAGNMWLMEINIGNEVRVRKIETAALSHAPPAMTNFINKARPVLLLVLLLLIVLGVPFLLIKIIRRKRAAVNHKI
jgi:hypothetical protein